MSLFKFLKKKKNSDTSSNNKEIFYDTKQSVVQKVLNCDDLHSQHIESAFKDVTGASIDNMIIVNEKERVKIAKVTANDMDYYMTISKGNCLLKIREESETGKVILQIMK